MAGIDPHIYFSAVAAVTVAADIKPLKCEAFASETVQLLITGSATVTFEGAGQLEKSDGTYYAIPATNLTTGATSTTATASGLYRVDVRGFNWFRPRVSTYSSGAVSAAGNATMVGGPAAGANTAIAAGEAHLGAIGGASAIVSAEFTRPADTTAYAVNDAVADSTSAPTVLTFTSAARVAAGSGYITKARLVTDQSANVAQFRLHLYRTSIAAINDNAAWTLLYTNRANYVGYIDLGPLATEGSGSDCASGQRDDARLEFVCAAAAQNLYGVLVTKTVFTPASGQKFFVELGIEQN